MLAPSCPRIHGAWVDEHLPPEVLEKVFSFFFFSVSQTLVNLKAIEGIFHEEVRDVGSFVYVWLSDV